MRRKKFLPIDTPAETVFYTMSVYFPGGEGDEDAIYPDGSAAGDVGRDGGQCGADADDVVAFWVFSYTENVSIQKEYYR